jgi:signal peptidase I
MNQLIALLAWLAIPVLLVVAYDHWFAEPKRPKKPDGEREPPPTWVAIANYLAPVVAIAAVVHIGIHEVFTWAKQIAGPVSWLAAPVGLLCLIDSWFFAPRRAIAAGTTDAPDPPLMAAAYFLLPFLVVAVIVRMISAESLDFSVVLLSLSVVTGVIWAIDNWLVRPRRERAAAAAAGGKPLALAEPGTVDYARSFFPVAFIVLIVRAFIFEPFRIPSDSMMPTLLDGDFIVVSKYSYGLRLPVINKTILSTGTPQRGDVVVFRYPPDPNVNFIKRLVGLPGDRIQVRDDHLIVNGETIELEPEGQFTDGCYVGLKLSTETLGTHTHQVMSCQAPEGLQSTRSAMMNGDGPFPACDRRELARRQGGYFCQERSTADNPDSGDHDFGVVPAGHYLMIGDNRDNSLDSRVWSYVPDANLVGKATRIWFNLDPQRSKPFNWSRIGDSIE